MSSQAKVRAFRTLLQFVVSAAFIQFVNALVVNLDPSTQLVATGVLQVVVSYAHKKLEEGAVIPTIGAK